MDNEIQYSSAERLFLWSVATVGLVGVNGVYLFSVFFIPGAQAEAMGNPISLAFMVEAFLLLVVLTYLLGKWGVTRLGRGWFVFLSLLGSIAFALPAVLLWPGTDRTDSADGDTTRVSSKKGGSR